MDRPYWASYRREQLAEVRGEVLEIGVGTGLNLPHYPEHVRRIVTADPNPGMNRQLDRRTVQTGVSVDKHIQGCERLPFDAERFDCVVSTLTLCSIRDVERAMVELLRVLKPGGQFIFLEHGLSPDTHVAEWQQRITPLQRVIADGCVLTLDIRELLASQPFDAVEIGSFYLSVVPKTHGYLYRGVGTK